MKIGLETIRLKIRDALSQPRDVLVSMKENSPLGYNGAGVLAEALILKKNKPLRSYEHGSYKKKTVYYKHTRTYTHAYTCTSNSAR